MSGSRCPWAHPLPVAPHSVLWAVHPLMPTVSDPAYRWLFAVPLWSAAGALGCSWAGLWCSCWASASGGRGGLGPALGACELTAEGRMSGAVSVSERCGGWWEAACGATHQACLPLCLSSSFPAAMSPVPEQGSARWLPRRLGGGVTWCLLPALLGSWFVSLLGRRESCLWCEDADF